MDAFNLLSQKMQRMVWQLKWEKFQSIQERAIPFIIQGEQDVVLSAGTASGKTEAAFLPILSLIETSALSELNVLYVSPLKALINNQFERIEKLCSLSDIAVHRWHGDVGQSAKKRLIKEPTGILQITPESIESLFVNRTSNLQHLFRKLQFIVIDEIHSFLDTERGVQLRSLISRLRPFSQNSVRIVGLSATIGDVEHTKQWINPNHPENVEVISAESNGRDLLCYLIHFPTTGPLLPLELLEDLRAVTRNQKALIFCNSRSRVEETTVFLNRLADREGIGETYFAHHASIDKDERERVEEVLSTRKEPKSVVSTSTLELGIDIGNIDLAVQLDSTFSTSSLKQRLGRTGRRPGAPQTLQIYTTQPDSLIQSLAVMELLLEGWVEPTKGYQDPYDILVHQILSICHQLNGVKEEDLVARVTSNTAFIGLSAQHLTTLIQHLTATDIIEKIYGKQELIVGLEGERILRSRDFYSVFMTPDEYHVMHGNREIGRLDKGVMIAEGSNVILAGKLWTIQHIDDRQSKIHVISAVDAKPPQFISGGAHLHERIPTKMWDILCGDQDFSYIDDKARAALSDYRQKYWLNGVKTGERIFWADGKEPIFDGYTGTIIGRTLLWMLRALGAPVRGADQYGRIRFSARCSLHGIFDELRTKKWNTEEILEQVKENERFSSKFTPLMPAEIVNQMHIAQEFDISGAVEFAQRIQLRTL